MKTYFIIGPKKEEDVVENVAEPNETALPKPEVTAVNIDGETTAPQSTESDTLMNDTSTSQVFHGNIDQTLMNSLHGRLNFLNRLIRLSCYYNRVYILCSLKRQVTPML